MIELIKSTTEEPLKFFQWIINSNNLKWYRSLLLREYEDEIDFAIIDKDKISYRTVYADNYDNPIEVTQIIDFSKELKKLLYIELTNSTKLIDSAIGQVLLHGGQPKPFLDLQLKNIETFLPIVKQISTDYPSVQEIIEKLIKYFKAKFDYLDIKRNINISLINEDSSDEEKEWHKNNRLIDHIFGYLKEEYMDADEWERLKGYLHQFLIDFRIPEVNPKFDKPNIPIWEFLHLFHVLYVQFVSKGAIVNNFSDFIIEAFTQFRQRKTKELSGKISMTVSDKNFSVGFPSSIKTARLINL